MNSGRIQLECFKNYTRKAQEHMMSGKVFAEENMHIKGASAWEGGACPKFMVVCTD